MRISSHRLAAVVCTSWALGGCPTDPVPVDETGDSGSESSSTANGTTTTQPGDTSTGPGADTSTGPGADTSTGPGAETSTGPGAETSTGGTPSVCGNNIIEGDEACDLAQVNGETCESLGYQGGQLGCLLTCEDYNLLGCFICGNEVVDIAEDCEGTVEEDISCESLGYEAGTIACGSDCLYDLSDCSICGDGIQAGPEQCDGLDYGGSTCASIGFDGGTLGCNLAACGFIYANCFGGQYIQSFEGGAPMPIEFDVDFSAPWFVDDDDPINGTWSARSGAFGAGVGGITDLELVASFPAAGSVTFVHQESCANGVDFLEFYVDGVFQNSWTGITGSAMHNEPVAAGNHTFRWRFSREGFLDEGLNAVFVDDITLDGGVPL
jgi:hypothetical protein